MSTFIIPALSLEAAIRALANHAKKPTKGAPSVIEGIAVTVTEPGRLEMASTDGYRLLVVDLTDRQIDGQFPNFRQIIPKSFAGAMTADARSLLAALKGLPVDKASGSPVKLRMNGSLVIEGQNAQATLPAKIEHDEGTEDVIVLNRDYLVDAIRAADPSPEITMRFNGPTQAALVHANADKVSASAIVMPIRA